MSYFLSLLYLIFRKFKQYLYQLCSTDMLQCRCNLPDFRPKFTIIWHVFPYMFANYMLFVSSQWFHMEHVLFINRWQYFNFAAIHHIVKANFMMCITVSLVFLLIIIKKTTNSIPSINLNIIKSCINREKIC